MGAMASNARLGTATEVGLGHGPQERTGEVGRDRQDERQRGKAGECLRKITQPAALWAEAAGRHAAARSGSLEGIGSSLGGARGRPSTSSSSVSGNPPEAEDDRF
jgi:hypothetical protein